MKSLWALAGLEFSRYRYWLPGVRGSHPRLVGGIFLVLIAGSLYLFRNDSNVEYLFATWVVLLLTTVSAWSFLNTMGISRNPYTEWWLTCPYPRKYLVAGKFLGLLRVSIHAGVMVGIAGVVHYWLSSQLGWTHGVGLSTFIKVLGADMLFTVISLPVVVSIGLLPMVFQVGWARIGMVFVFLLYEQIPLAWGFLSTVVRKNPEGIVGPSHVLGYTAWALVVGWPIALLCFLLVSSVGMKRMGEARYRKDEKGESTVEQQDFTHVRVQDKGQNKEKHPFWALYTLEKTKYRFIGSKATRISNFIAMIILIFLMAEGFVSAQSVDGLARAPVTTFAFVYVILVIYSMSLHQGEFQKGRGQWWLTYPHSRFVLLGSRILAFWVTALFYLALASIGFGVGVVVRSLIYPIPPENITLGLRYAGDSGLLMILLFTFHLLILQIAPALYKKRVWMLLLVLVYFSFSFGMRWIVKWVLPDSSMYIENGPLPDFWYHVSWLCGIGIPLAVICFWLGGKYLNEYANYHEVYGRLFREKK